LNNQTAVALKTADSAPAKLLFSNRAKYSRGLAFAKARPLILTINPVSLIIALNPIQIDCEPEE
jgi:hypothetical protein